MSRIATGLLIVAVVLAFNAGMLRDAFAEDQAMRARLETPRAGGKLRRRAARIAA